MIYRYPCVFLVMLLVAMGSPVGAAESAETVDYSLVDADLKLVRLDFSPTESFLSIRADSRGRLFVGGREALFLYEPDERGGYMPRRELYRFPEHSWIYDIELRGPDLYVLTLNALYIFPKGAVKQDGLVPKRLVWGVPMGHVHQCFHQLAWGPEGDLYISMGDPLWNYGDFNRPDHWGYWSFFSQPAGTKLPYCGVGGVFRCRPDGSRLQVVARGLRNSCGLVFDKEWNLFTNDNDDEGKPDGYVPGRLLHVTPHSDFSWPRGWMVAITPDRADLLETMVTGMGRSVPVGQCYYDDTFLPARFRHNLLVARWGQRSVTRYPLRHRGASFTAKEHSLLSGRNRARPVGVSVGRGGRIFAAISSMAHNEGSPVYPSDLVMITRADDTAAFPFVGFDMVSAESSKLFQELSHPAWSRRRQAHIELVRRGDRVAVDALARLERVAPDDLARPHLIWIAVAAARSAETSTDQSNRIKAVLGPLTADAESAIRLQAVRALSEFFPRDEDLRSLFVRALTDLNAQVRQAALVSFFKATGEIPRQIIHGPARSSDTYLRQAATLLLAERATVGQISGWCGANDAKTRLAGVLAAGFRLTVPPATRPIPDHLPLEPWHSEKVYRLKFAHETVDLRDLGRTGLFTFADHWKAAKHSAEQEELFGLLRTRLNDPVEKIRLQAAHFLYLLNDARTEPLIARVRRENVRRKLLRARTHRINPVWAVGPFDDRAEGLGRVHKPEVQAIDVTAEYLSGRQTLRWSQIRNEGSSIHNLSEQFGKCDQSSFYVYTRLESFSRQEAMLLLGSDDGIKVWINGRVVWTNKASRSALPFEDVVFVNLEPGSNDLLTRVQNHSGECAVYLHYRSLGKVVQTLPDQLDVATLEERLVAAAADSKQTTIPPEFLQVDWRKEVSNGDAARGRQLFAADGIGCAKCHAASPGEAVEGGPSLAEAAKRFTLAHLVESVLLPSKQVSPVFRSTLIVTKQGKTHVGLVIGENAEKLDLLTPEAKRLTLVKSEIEDRKLQDSSPMPAGIVRKRDELRDLLAFLFSTRGQ
jgi:putative heme-binding domain-containing protein